MRRAYWLRIPIDDMRFCRFRYGADELVTHFTIEAAETRAWAPPSVNELPLPLGLTGAHVFHVWLGRGRVLEVFEVRGLWARLSDCISRLHVRRILAAMRMRPMRPLAVTFGDFLGAIPRAAPHFQSGRGRSSRFEATVRTSCSGIQSRALDAAARSCKRYRIRFDDGHTTILAAYELLTVSASARSTGQIVLGVAHTLLVCFAALPCRVLGGRRRGPAASVFASADREGRAACPKGQAQRNWCGHGPWAKASNGDHEVEERHAQVWRRFRVVLASLVQPGFRGAHGVHGVLKRPSSVWHFCSRALRAWAFHVRERRRLRKVRALSLTHSPRTACRL
jgi:hypothetical protein